MQNGTTVAPPSLYRLLGEPVAQTEHDADPSTRHTASVETIDNDHAVAAYSSLGLAAGSGPGTILTHKVETVDNDHAADLLTLASLDASQEGQY